MTTIGKDFPVRAHAFLLSVNRLQSLTPPFSDNSTSCRADREGLKRYGRPRGEGRDRRTKLRARCPALPVGASSSLWFGARTESTITHEFLRTRGRFYASRLSCATIGAFRN